MVEGVIVGGWNFVIAAYAVVIVGTLGMALWSWIAMKRAEARRDAVRKK